MVLPSTTLDFMLRCSITQISKPTDIIIIIIIIIIIDLDRMAVSTRR